MEEFTQLDRLLVIGGTKIFKRSTISNIVNNFQFYALLVVSALLTFHSLISIDPTKRSMVYHIVESAEDLFGIAILAVWRIKARKLSSLLIFLSKIGDKNKEKLRRFGRKLTVSCITYIFIIGALYGEWIYEMLFKRKDVHGLTNSILQAYSALSSWLVIGVYSYFVKNMALYEKVFFDKLIKAIRSSDASPNQIQIRLKNLRDSKESLNESFSFIPLVWFLWSFCQATNAISALFDLIDENPVAAIHDLCRLLAAFAFLAFLCIYVDSVVRESRSHLESISWIIASRQDVSEWDPVLTQIELEKKFEYRVWNMFPLNKSLLLSFSSSLLTFTVLFVQLTQHLKDSNDE